VLIRAHHLFITVARLIHSMPLIPFLKDRI